MLSIHERAADVRRTVGRSVCRVELAYRRNISSNGVFPTDEPHGTVDGVGRDRVAILGDWNTVGMGISTYELSLPACFSRALSTRTGRGVHWEIVPVDGFRLSAVPDAVAANAMGVAGVQVAILQLGATESMQFVAPRQWHDDLVAAVEAVLASMGDTGCLVIAAVPPLGVIGTLTSFSAREIGRECRALNAMSREVAERYPQCLYTDFPEGLADEVWSASANDFRFSHSYAVWGASLARALVFATEGADSRDR